MTMMEQLITMSRKYGSNPEYVLGGGGNTSLKDGDTLYVKASGTTLATIDGNGFVAIDRNRLQNMWKRVYSPDSARREAEVLEDLMASRRTGQTGRPSVETTLHDLMDFRLVLHLHPAMVNGLACSQDDEAWVKENLGDEVVWLKATKPGFILAEACRTLIHAYQAEHSRAPQILLIENHGVFFAADTLAEMDALAERFLGRIRTAAKKTPDPASVPFPPDTVSLENEIRTLVPGSFIVSESNRGIRALSDGEPEIRAPFTPDHIVYCGPYPLYSTQANLRDDFQAFVRQHGFPPKVLLIRGYGLVALGKTEKLAHLAKDLFLDEVKILAYSKNFGGPRFMSPEDIDFILHWEVENYRVQVTQK